MSSIELSLNGSGFLISKKCLSQFFEHRPGLFQQRRYVVQSQVGTDVFREFLKAMETNSKISPTKDNAPAFALLAHEFYADRLLANPDIKAHSVSQVAEKPLENLLTRGVFITEADVANLWVVPEDTLHFRMNPEKPLNGIIAYLTTKYGGNVHDKGVVDITSSSTECDDDQYQAKHVADFSGKTHFGSKDLRNSWLNLDFKDMRITPTHYTMVTFHNVGKTWRAIFLRSWILEGSEDGEKWIELDRQSDSILLKGPDRMATFRIANRSLCRMLRLRATASGYGGLNCLELYAFEVFGTILTSDRSDPGSS
jgi:hypothetical protein